MFIAQVQERRYLYFPYLHFLYTNVWIHTSKLNTGNNIDICCNW